MCGIAGFWQARNFSTDSAYAVAERMASRIVHRGPDDGGIWLDDSAGLVLAHRRLSIVDLSPAGHQPMLSESQRYVLAFNGEIYNHAELRAELEPVGDCSWRGHSDTETLLAGFEAWGIETMLTKAVGMFAIALWDRRDKILTLARDRIGEKPLYYGFQGDSVLFGSELKALQANPDFVGDIDRGALAAYLRYCYIPAPYSIYQGIRKIEPGCYLQLPVGRGIEHLKSIRPNTYWRLADVVAQGQAEPFQGSDGEAIEWLDSSLRRSIGLQMIADVPLGAFLSGGIDSSLIVALMQAQASRPVKTFSIGFTEAGYNEAEYAKAVAGHLGTEHTELYVSSEQAMRVIPRLGSIYDEPFADSSQIPTLLVAQLARSQVTVSLSGDAGDELFCGYNRYTVADRWHKIAKIPFGARRLIGHGLHAINPAVVDSVFRQLGKVVAVPGNMGQKVGKLASQLQRAKGIEDLYFGLVSASDDPAAVLVDRREASTWLTETGLGQPFADAKAKMMYWDAMTYLPDDILVKVDRAAMAVGLETRVPFLDHRIVEMAWRLPMSMKYRDGQSKWLLRQLLDRYVPRPLIERPKTGFGIPLADWLRGPLREWADALIDESRLRREGFFDADLVRRCWQQHLDGRRDWQTLLWNVLMFQAWLEGESR